MVLVVQLHTTTTASTSRYVVFLVLLTHGSIQNDQDNGGARGVI